MIREAYLHVAVAERIALVVAVAMAAQHVFVEFVLVAVVAVPEVLRWLERP